MAQLAAPHRILGFGSFEVDIVSGELRRQGVKIRLQDQPFRLLVLLLERAGDVVTREEVREKLWPADTYVDFDHSLNTAVRKLREALGDSAEAPRYVETLARRGYRFIAPVALRRTPQAAHSANAGVASVLPSPAARPSTSARRLLIPCDRRRDLCRGPRRLLGGPTSGTDDAVRPEVDARGTSLRQPHRRRGPGISE